MNQSPSYTNNTNPFVERLTSEQKPMPHDDRQEMMDCDDDEMEMYRELACEQQRPDSSHAEKAGRSIITVPEEGESEFYDPPRRTFAFHQRRNSRTKRGFMIKTLLSTGLFDADGLNLLKDDQLGRLFADVTPFLADSNAVGGHRELAAPADTSGLASTNMSPDASSSKNRSAQGTMIFHGPISDRSVSWWVCVFWE